MTSTDTTPSQQTTQSHIDTCSAHANPTWKEAALAATMRLASRCEQFTSYDVLQELAKSNVSTPNLRAIGAVMQEARNLGLIRGIGLVRMNNEHTRGATVLWQSRLYTRPSNTTLPKPL